MFNQLQRTDSSRGWSRAVQLQESELQRQAGRQPGSEPQCPAPRRVPLARQHLAGMCLRLLVCKRTSCYSRCTSKGHGGGGSSLTTGVFSRRCPVAPSVRRRKRDGSVPAAPLVAKPEIPPQTTDRHRKLAFCRVQLQRVLPVWFPSLFCLH